MTGSIFPNRLGSAALVIGFAAVLTASGVCAAGAAAAQSADQASASAAAPVDLNVDCTTVSDATERLNCWDSHARATTAQKKVASKRLFGLSTRQTQAAATAPAPRRHARAEKVRTAKVEDDSRHVVLTLASVGDTPDGRLLLTSTDGAVWEQTDSDPIRELPAPGATVSVRRGPLGGYMCDVTRWQPVRCKRDQ